MPLITITTSKPLQPMPLSRIGNARQQIIAELGSALPLLFVTNINELHLDPDTPPESVQVDYKLFHPGAINAPDIWILVVLSEVHLSDEEKRTAARELKRIVLEWFDGKEMLIPRSMAVDCHWVASHGFIKTGGGIFEW